MVISPIPQTIETMEMNMERVIHRKVKKGWGHEDIFAASDRYCGKFLVMREGGRMSMHFHAEKDEVFHVLEGAFLLHWINTETAEHEMAVILDGETIHIPPLTPHSLECTMTGVVLEVSSYDNPSDNYRIEPGDSQREGKK